MVVVTFCRPHRRAGWVVVALLAGAAAVLFTGSRGAWPGLAVIAVVAPLAGGWRVRFPPLLWLLFACLPPVVGWFLAAPGLSRMDALQRDAVLFAPDSDNYSQGVLLDAVGAATRPKLSR